MPDVLMPRLSDSMAEGTLSQWLKHDGDQVRKGDILTVIETDKAAMEMEAYDEGVLTTILVGEGSSVPIGTAIAVIGQAAAGVPASSPAAPTPPADMPPPGEQAAASAAPPRLARPATGPVWTSPLARNLARGHGIDLTAISGTGAGGRIVRAEIGDAIRQLDAAQPMPQPAAAAPAGEHAGSPRTSSPAAPSPSATSARAASGSSPR